MNRLILVILVAVLTISSLAQTIDTPSADKALVYVYRQGHILGAAGRPLIFVNDYLLAEMHNSNYAPLEVPQGTVVVTATFANTFGDLQIPWATGYWASLPGCAGLDARRFFAAPPADVALCYRRLTELYRKCEVTVSVEHWGGFKTITTRVPFCNYELNGSGDALYLLNLVLSPKLLLRERLRIEVEAGKAYYVKWSVSSSGGKMQLVDAAKGAKEIQGLHLAKKVGNEN